MDVLSDEHEREEVVRKWWHEHWKPITLGIVITLAGLVGIRQYQSWQLSNNQETAFELYTIQQKLDRNGSKAVADADKFIQEHKDVYGSLLALDLARFSMGANKLEDAIKYINFAKANGGDLIVPQATTVLARLQAQDGKYDDALKTIDGVKDSAYQSEALEIKGDILMAKGDEKGAHDAYAQAIKVTRDAQLQISHVLQMKFDNVIQAGDTPAFKMVAEDLAKQEKQFSAK